jgi:hypothetical protein
MVTENPTMQRSDSAAMRGNRGIPSKWQHGETIAPYPSRRLLTSCRAESLSEGLSAISRAVFLINDHAFHEATLRKVEPDDPILCCDIIA